MSSITTTPREQLEKLVHDMQTLADECDAKGVTTPEDVQKLNEMGADVKSLVEAVKVQASANGTLDLAKAFLGDLASPAGSKDDRAPGSPEQIGGIVNPKGMTLGEAVANSPAYEDFLKQFKGHDGSIKGNSIKSASIDFPGFSAKTLVTGASDTQAGAFVRTERYPIVSDLIGERRLTVRDLCTNISISSDTFDFVTVTSKTNAAAAVPEATVSTTPGLGGVAVGAYDATHGLKPESALAFAVVSAPVETIAHLMPITRRAAADAPQVRQLIDAFLLYGLKEEEEDQILNGNGTSPNLRGILQTAGINTVGSAGTDLDAIVDGIRTIRLDNREPTAMVIHPNDWYSTGFLLAKDTAGNYLVGDPRASLDQLNALWGLRVVVTPAMTENTVLVGDFKQAVVADREQSAIYVTDSHNDWFARNLLAVLAEERLALGVLDPDAFCTVTAV